MGLFSRSRVATNNASVPPMGSGRRLRSNLQIEDALQAIEKVIDGYRSRQYPHLPHLVPTGHDWLLRDEAAPAAVYSGGDYNRDFLLFTLWRAPHGCEIGVFPLGVGDDRLQIPFIGHLKQVDSSLSSIGLVPRGSVSLRPPPVPDDFVIQLLAIARYPVTQENCAIIAQQFYMQTRLKAHQFISGKAGDSVGQRYLDRWATAEFDATMTEPVRAVLRDLASWDPGILPYIQDIPLRMRAIMLEAQDHKGTFWDDLVVGHPTGPAVNVVDGDRPGTETPVTDADGKIDYTRRTLRRR
ncbi:MAG: hypothetical protein ACT4P1_11390 [Sporichthyaceae bacterium]